MMPARRKKKYLTMKGVMLMPDHYIIKCSCGTILEQCRCFDPSKHVEIRQEACAMCQLVTQERRTIYVPASTVPKEVVRYDENMSAYPVIRRTLIETSTDVTLHWQICAFRGL